MTDESPKSATQAAGEPEAEAATGPSESEIGESESAAGENQSTNDSGEHKPAGAGNGSAQADEAETQEDPAVSLAAAREEAERLRDAALRAQAETENIRRRAARDVESARRFALEQFASDLLSVADSLEKAVESASVAVDAAAVGEGVQLSLKLFLDTLRKHGIEQVDPHGQPFDPAQQEAMAAIPNADAEPNSVMEVVRKGYLLNGRVVRAAQVIVTKAVEARADPDPAS